MGPAFMGSADSWGRKRLICCRIRSVRWVPYTWSMGRLPCRRPEGRVRSFRSPRGCPVVSQRGSPSPNRLFQYPPNGGEESRGFPFRGNWPDASGGSLP